MGTAMAGPSPNRYARLAQFKDLQLSDDEAKARIVVRSAKPC